MKKLVLITTYFGKFPEYFNLWLKSAGNNKGIDFLIYSDCDTKDFSIPENVKVIPISFSEIKEMFQSKFDFEITLDTPYKFCDYKPAYGYVFQQDIKDYKYWGHVDTDAILGNIEGFLPKEDYDKIYQFGHLCIYKNTDDNNRRFMQEGGQFYKDVFTTKNITVFDEVVGMQKKFELLGIPTYQSRDYADITKRRFRMTLSDIYLSGDELKYNNYDYQVFYYENGKVYRDFINKNGEMKTQEFNYIHFSSRSPKDFTGGCDNFYITNKGFFPKNEKVTKEIIEKYNPLSPKADKRETIRWRIKDAERKIKKIIQAHKENR